MMSRPTSPAWPPSALLLLLLLLRRRQRFQRREEGSQLHHLRRGGLGSGLGRRLERLVDECREPAIPEPITTGCRQVPEVAEHLLGEGGQGGQRAAEQIDSAALRAECRCGLNVARILVFVAGSHPWMQGVLLRARQQRRRQPAGALGRAQRWWGWVGVDGGGEGGAVGGGIRPERWGVSAIQPGSPTSRRIAAHLNTPAGCPAMSERAALTSDPPRSPVETSRTGRHTTRRPAPAAALR